MKLTPYIPDIPEEKFEGEFQLRKRMAVDFPFYAEKNLKIAPKQGPIIPFVLNDAQLYIHKKLEEQRKKVGYVRAILIKGRQQGASTLVAGRYYWKVTKTEATNAFILSHAKDTTKKLFSMTRRYYDKSDDMFKPRTGLASSTEFSFPGLDSTYTVGTAGAKDVGRGGTIHYFHGSEVAYWAYIDTHFMGIMESVPSGKFAGGSEIILESTANGMTGKFYDLTMEAIAGENEYQVIFTPWYWQYEYRNDPPIGWEVPLSEKDYQDVYALDIEQMYWRHLKTRTLGSEWKFKQEYPCSIAEAFQTSGEESFISPRLAMAIRAPKPELLDGTGARIGAGDPAWKGDRASCGWRTDKRVHEVLYYENKDPTELANIYKSYIIENQLDAFFVDVIGIGAGVYSDILHTPGFERIVKACNFSNASSDRNPDGTKKYKNHRAECWGRMKEDMDEGEYYEIPNDEEVAADLQAPQYHYNNPQGALQLESKEDMRKRGVKSPDAGDVIAMTYSEVVHPTLRNDKKRDMVIPTDYDVLD